MRDALLKDLSELPYEISTTIDLRLVKDSFAFSEFFTSIGVNKHEDVWDIWQAQMQAADAVWLIAPETGGILKKLTQMAEKPSSNGLQDPLLLGCGLGSIEVASKKMDTYFALEAAGIASIPTYTFENWPKNHQVWLAKPNDGAGCSDTVCFNNAGDLEGWIIANHKQISHVIQPFQAGDAGSISCVMQHGKAQLLSCNTQHIKIQHQKLSYTGGVINGMRDYWPQFEFIANKIAQALPNLAGYVGVDVIVDGDEVVVVEINPRLTTAYIGLHESIGANPAELIINTLAQPDYRWPTLQINPVSINV